MAFIRCCLTTAVLVFCMFHAQAQTVYYPQGSSQLLKSTAEDVSMLFQKAVKNTQLSIQPYNSIPSTGIILVYDPAITDNQACKVESDGVSYIRFSAAQDNGLCYGIYQYLNTLGFRFYQPGTIWEIIPSLNSVYRKIDSIYTTSYKYKTWFVSGGHNRWVMDNNTNYGWDTYFGENGHNWALYQRRNGMVGAYRFSGHRGDIMNGDYLAALQSNPCYVACYNGSRSAGNRSVPDIFNVNAVSLWANTIEQKYTQGKNIIFGNTTLYANQYRNFNYFSSMIGIEVPDGANWGNSKSAGCSNTDYPKESDQQFLLANMTAEKILTKYPDKHLQVYAYSTHADIPSPAIAINKNIDVQLIPAVYQLETSTNGIRNRWYNRSENLSEYHYLNLSGWSGETPSFTWKDLKTTLQIARDKRNQGIVWEASPAKFGSLPYLLAANNNLKDGTDVDSTLRDFCNRMFEEAGPVIYKLFFMWGDENAGPSKYKMQLYLELLNTAVQQTQNAQPIVKDRIRELKAYLHYMVLYFDLSNDDQARQAKADKDAELCLYLARTNKMQLVNSYYLITTIVSRYQQTDDFYTRYNVLNGTAYQNGNLALITAAEIDSNFEKDLADYGSQLDQFTFYDAEAIRAQMKRNNIVPLDKINAKISYTNGMNYYNKTSFHFIAPAAGSIKIEYTPRFDMPDKGYINFLVEADANGLEVIKDLSIERAAGAGSLTVNLPRAGQYVLTISSKYKSAVDITITTNGNYFYKKGAFLGNKTESYNADLRSLPGFFFVPKGLNRFYFQITNGFSTNRFASAESIQKSFDIRDNNGKAIPVRFVTPKDSSLFYMEVANTTQGLFLQATKMEQYVLQFVNISNMLWYAERKTCASADFKIDVIQKNGRCMTRLTAMSNSGQLGWDVSDGERTLSVVGQQVVELPESWSPNTIVALSNGSACSMAKRIGDDQNYLKEKLSCAAGASLPNKAVIPVLYPNPSNGVFNCLQNGAMQTASEVIITNVQGGRVGSFKNVKQFDISQAPAGLYMYKILVNGEEFTGKLVKL